MSEFPSFLRLNNILLYIYTILLSAFLLTDPGCFYLLAVVNIAAMNECANTCFESLLSVLVSIHSEMESLGHILILALILGDLPSCNFFTVSLPCFP